jgi:hypothetical protein
MGGTATVYGDYGLNGGGKNVLDSVVVGGDGHGRGGLPQTLVWAQLLVEAASRGEVVRSNRDLSILDDSDCGGGNGTDESMGSLGGNGVEASAALVVEALALRCMGRREYGAAVDALGNALYLGRSGEGGCGVAWKRCVLRVLGDAHDAMGDHDSGAFIGCLEVLLMGCLAIPTKRWGDHDSGVRAENE